MPENPLAIANGFIEIAREQRTSLTALKLLKLVYLAHGWYLALTDTPLVAEAVEACRIGPIFNSLYHRVKYHKNRPIHQLESTIDSKTLEEFIPLIRQGEDPLLRPFLEKIWEVYGSFKVEDLSALAYEPGSPWYKIWEKSGGKECIHMSIPSDLIKDYFTKKLEAVGITEPRAKKLNLEEIRKIREPIDPATLNPSDGVRGLESFDKLVELDTKKEQLESLKQDRGERKCYADRIYRQTTFWLWTVLLLVLLSGFGKAYGFFVLGDAVILGVIGGTTTTIVGLFVIVVKYLFPNK